MFMKCLAVAVSAIVATNIAGADQYRFTATGTLSTPYSVDGNFNPVSTFPTTLRAGDAFSISFLIDPAKFTVSSYYDADPTINIYNGTVSSYRLTIGTYTSTISGNITFADSQLWDNHLSSGSPTDAFTLDTLQTISSASAPIILKSPTVNEIFGFNAFDFTAMARHSDLITEITSLTGFSSLSAHIGFLDPVTYDQTVYQINGMVANITAVPETSTWAMMIVGFGVVGTIMGRKRLHARSTTVRLA